MGKIIGIDLGSHELKIAEWNGSAVTSLVSAETPDNLVKNGRVISYEAAGDFIRETLKEKGIASGDCSLILPDGNAFLLRVTVPKMTEDKLLVNLPYEFRDFLTDDKAKYYYDYIVNGETLSEDGKTGEMEITAAAIPKDLIYSYRFMCRRAGLKLKYAVPAEMAYANIIGMSSGKGPEERAFLDFGHERTRLNIYSGKIYEVSRMIDTGLVQVDRRIAESENVDEHIAHSYKEADYNGVAFSEDSIEVYNHITTEVRRAVNFYTLNNRESNLSDIYLCGGGCCIDALRKTAEENIEGTIHEASELFPSYPSDTEHASKYALAVGAAIQGKGMNLAKKDKSQFRPQLMLPLIAGILILVALFAKFCVIDRFAKLQRYNNELASERARVTQLEKDTADYDEVLDEYNKYSTKWMTDDEKAVIDRLDILALIESELVTNARVLNFSSDRTTITAEISNLTLNDTSKLVSRLYERDDVVSVSVYSAKSEEDRLTATGGTAAGDAEQTQEGTPAESPRFEVVKDSNVILTIVMRRVEED